MILYSVLKQLRKEITTRGYFQIKQFACGFKDVRTLTQATRTWSGISSIITAYRFALPLFDITTKRHIPTIASHKNILDRTPYIWDYLKYSYVTKHLTYHSFKETGCQATHP